MAIVHSSAFNFADVVQKFLQDYSVEVMDDVTEAIDEVSKEAVKKLRSDSSAAFGGGDYARGWTRKVEQKRLQVYATVYGKKPTYSLAHLLEHGHVTRNGTGRTYADTPAHVHIEPVEQWAVNEAVDRAVSKLESRV